MEQRSLGDFLDQEVVPRLAVEDIFTSPAHAWKERGKTWKGGCPWHESKSGTAFTVDPETLRWWCPACQEGGGPVQYLWKKSGGTGKTPHGTDFVELVRELAGKAGVTFPERELTEEEKAKAREREARRSLLDVVIHHAEEVLWSPAGEAARRYLKEDRGFTDEDARSLRLGLYDSVAGFRAAVTRAGVDTKDTEDAAVLWSKLEGYIVIPWMDERGRPLTLYGRWKEKTPPPDRPKTIALPGEGTKRSPLYFDRARAAGVSEVVLVEGVFDAALLQARGDARVVASVGAEASKLQVETLVRSRVKTVFICGDPDGGGDNGTLANIRNLSKAGLSCYVVPRLPDGLDPDEFLLRDGMEAWRERVRRSIPGAVFKATHLLAGITPESPEKERREAVDKVLEVVDGLRGENAAMDQESALRLAAERTGFSLEVLEERAQAHEKRRRAEETEKALEEAVRSAQEAAGKKPAHEIAQDLVHALARLETKTETEPLAFSVERLWKETKRRPAGKTSGWAALDEQEIRFNAGELAILGARTGHAKTTSLVGLLWNFVRAAAKAKTDEVFVFYSSEEPEDRIFHRLLALATVELKSGWTRTEIRAWARDPLSRTDWPSAGDVLEAARDHLQKLEDRLLVVYRPGWNVDRIAAHALSLEKPVGGVFVDYLQRIPPPEAARKADRRDIEVSHIARRLKGLSVELDTPVLVGAQINREAIPDKYAENLTNAPSYKEATSRIRTARPDLHHLREGGAEQEADLVLGLLNYAADYRAEAKKRDVPLVTLLEIGTLKTREGEPGSWAGLAFEGRYGLIRDPKPREEEDLVVERLPSRGKK
jgi:DNA primase catalytic core